jgi:chemotaxis protein MotB
MDRRIATDRALRLALALVLTGTLACVSSGKYESLAAERDAVAAERETLEGRVAELEGEREELAQRLSASTGEISEMRGTYDALLTELEQEVAAGQIQIQKLKDGIRMNLSQDILFPTGSAELDAQGRDVLTRVSEQLASSSYRVEVEGHTDNLPIRGALAKTYPTNWELAGARAARVVRLFEQKGVDRERMVAVSFGELRPVASNDDEQGRARNRRIEIRLLPDQGGTVPAAPDDLGWGP